MMSEGLKKICMHIHAAMYNACYSGIQIVALLGSCKLHIVQPHQVDNCCAHDVIQHSGQENDLGSSRNAAAVFGQSEG